jgi:DNA-damage-inducible protein D
MIGIELTMKGEEINVLFTRFESAASEIEGVECWSAREMQNILGYGKWENFEKVIQKAKVACENTGEEVLNHFPEVRKMVELGSGSARQVEDIALTKSEKKLSGIIYERSVDDRGFARIRSKGDQALFGGFSTNDMKKQLGVPEARPLADFLPTLTIKAKDFATELTSHNVIDKNLEGETSISNEHVDNNLAVRSILAERGIKPEALPPAEDVKKVQRKLNNDNKKVLKNSKIIK